MDPNEQVWLDPESVGILLGAGLTLFVGMALALVLHWAGAFPTRSVHTREEEK